MNALSVAAAIAAAAAQPLPAEPAVDVIAAVPDGLVKTVLERMPDKQRSALEAAASFEIQKVREEAASGKESEDPRKAIEQLVGARIALLGVANTFEGNPTALHAWGVSDPSELRAAALAPEVAKTSLGRRLRGIEGLRAIEEMLKAMPYIYRPRTPCGETANLDPLRLSACVDRKEFRSVVGLAWREGDHLSIHCSGQLISRTLVLTADHCFDGQTAKPIVLTHYTGGNDQAVVAVSGHTVTGLTSHTVASVHRGTTQALANDLRGYDLAVLELASPVGFDGFPTLGLALPNPLKMTAAGWGLADAQPVNNVALEVTVISPLAASWAISPSLRAWPATPVAGGGICRGDSGGPIFSGSPDNDGPASRKLIGLVAGGNLDCRSGNQVITDLTNPATVAYMCGLFARNPYCVRS